MPRFRISARWLWAAALCAASAAHAGELRVGVATSLYRPASTLARDFEAAAADRVVRASFGASSVLAAQARAGAPLDVLLLADPQIADRLERGGAVAMRRDFASNRLVVVTRDASFVVRSAADLTDARFARIAIPEHTVPVGRYARAWLARHGALDAIELKSVHTEHARATLLAVDQGHVDAAVVYATDAALARHAVVAYEVPAGEAPEILYVGVVLADAHDVDEARAFLDFAASTEARSVLAAAGFGPAPSGEEIGSAGVPVARMRHAAGTMSSADWPSITLLTLRVATVATLLSLAPAVWLGHLLARRRFRGDSLVRALVALPMVLPPVAVGLALLLLLGPRGPLGGVLDALGLEIAFTWWAAVMAAAVVGFPLLVRACEQSFAEVDVRFERVARSLGLGRLRAFFAVTLPLARRGVLYGSLLAFTRALGEFGATAVVAGILPGRTETLALGIYARVQLGDDRAALLLCAASFVLALGALLVGETWLRRRTPSAGGAP